MTHLSLRAPHPPFVAPAPYNSMYPIDTLPGFTRATSRTVEAATHPLLALFSKTHACTDNPTELRKHQASYYGLVSEVDANLGRLFHYLKETGQWDNTLIVFTSDHGEQMGDHWLKGALPIGVAPLSPFCVRRSAHD